MKAAIAGRILFAAFVLLSCNKGPSASEDNMVISGSTMGSYYRVTLSQLAGQENEHKLRAVIEARLKKINSMMSTYLEDSEVSRFNRSARTDWYPVSEETARVVEEALEVFQQSGGAFDITLAPVVNLWGFGPAKNPSKIPSRQGLAEALKKTGSQHLHVRISPPALKKDKRELQIDLSGIAKGYALDSLALFLKDLGFSNYLIDIGGEMLASGVKGNGGVWKIAIETPTVNQRGIQRVLELHDLAIATSGDYRNYFESEGQRYSHEIDPQTGRPIQNGTVSVSLLDVSCMRADAWATALMVMEPQRARRLSEDKNMRVLIIAKNDTDGFSEWESAGFKRLFTSP